MTLLLAKIVDPSTMGKVIGYSLVATIGLTLAFSLFIVGANGVLEARRTGRGAVGFGYGVLAVVALAATLGAIVYGIILMAEKK